MVWFGSLKIAADRDGCAKPALSLLVTWFTAGLRSRVAKPGSRQR
jgi:hypothetical protein